MGERLVGVNERIVDDRARSREAIQDALDGFAVDSNVWLRARDIFERSYDQSGSLDYALREAIGAASENAESKPGDATRRFWRRLEGENGPHEQYGDAINGALDGYASTSKTWLHGRDTFFDGIRQGEPLEIALQSAIDSASENSESSSESAKERFWALRKHDDSVEQYGAAISDALDGYARDGPIWLRARAVFFDAIREGRTAQMALNEALALASEGAESTTQQAGDRFWQRVGAKTEMREEPKEEHWIWPDQTAELGTISRIELSEAEETFERVEIRGDGGMGALTPELLENSGLVPRHRMDIEDRTVWFSPAFDIGGGRAATIGYVQDEDGTVVARSYYRSNSQGVWRYLPQYAMTEGKVRWYSKGYGEESVTLPAILQEGLTRSMQDDGDLLELDSATAQMVFIGTARRAGDPGTAYHRNVSRYPSQLTGLSETHIGELPRPETLQLTHEQTPDFGRVLASWEQDTSLYGRVMCERIPSIDGTINYVFNRDSQGRAWIGSIENNSPIESTGLREIWMTGGALATPVYEYVTQSDGYGNDEDQKGPYTDMFTNYLSKIPVIQEYLAQVS